MKNGKKLCLLLSCVVLMTLLCAFAAAESADSGFEITGGVLTKYTGPGGDVVIPDGVTEIGSSAFANCGTLTSVVIPEGVTKIGDKAFNGCYNLTSVTLPATLKTLGKNVFDYCSSLASFVDKSGRCVKILNGVVYNADGTEFVAVLASASGEIHIAEGVTEIPARLFQSNPLITGVVFPKGITKIGESAFNNCTGLQRVQLPEGLTEIGQSAFSSCNRLSQITFPESLTKIGGYAFNGCRRLLQITLPEGLQTVEYNAFSGTGLTSLTIPEGLTSVGRGAFSSNRQLISVTLKGRSAILQGGAFGGCPNLREVNGSDVKTVDGIVYSADGTQLVALLSTVSGSIRLEQGITSIPFGFFQGNERITEVVIPTGISTIEGSSFAYCKNLKSVTLSKGVTQIGDSAFYSCEKLTSITLPKGVTHIGDSAFGYCEKLTSLTLPEGLTSIGWGAFEGCTGLKSITLPSTLINLDSGAFDRCTNLQEINDLSGKYCKVEDGIVYSKDGTKILMVLTTCTGDVRIADGVKEIAASAFTGRSGITSVTLPDSVTQLERNTFSDCSDLQSVILPKTLESLPWGIFSGCQKLTDVSLPAGLKTMEGYAFQNCGSLREITLPEGLQSIGIGTFLDCRSLTSVTLPASLESLQTGVFGGCTGLTDIQDLSGKFLKNIDGIVYSADQTRIVTVLASVSGNVEFAEGIMEIPMGLFDGNTRITGVVIPEGATRLDWLAFRNCVNLETVQLPESLTRIEEEVFEGCQNLTGITLPAGLEYIGMEAFAECGRLSSITLPAGLQYNEPMAFRNCNGLTELQDLSGRFYQTVDGIVYSADGSEAVLALATVSEDVQIMEGVTSIAAYALAGQEKIVSVLLPDSVLEINSTAISENVLIRSSATAYARTWAQENGRQWEHDVHTIAALPAVEATYTEPGKTEGSYCPECGKVLAEQEDVPALGEKDFTFTTDDTGATVTGYKGESTEVHIPSVLGGKPVTKIAEKAFYSDLRITGMHIPASVAEIEEFSFYQCRALDTITVNAESPYYTVEGNVLYTKDMTTLVRAGNVLEDGDLHVPSTVTYIAAGAFSDNKTLQELWIPASVQFINGTNSCGSFCRNFRRFHIDEGNTQYASPDGALYNRTVTQLFLVPEAIGTYRVPDSVTSIADCAIGGTYYGSTTTLDVTMPEKLAFTGNCMFQWMRGTVTFLNPKIRFGEKCFMSSQDSVIIRGYAGSTAQTYAKTKGIQFEDIEAGLAFQYTTDDTGATVTGYTGQGGTVEIPSMLGGKPVVAIGDTAFKRNETITSVTMPDSVTTIGQRAFYDCKALKQLTLPENLTDIGAYAFSGCLGLQNVTLPEKLATIAERAFDYTGLTAIHIPASVTMIGQRALSQNYDLLKITVDEANTVYCAEDNILYNKDKTTLIRAGSGLSGDWSIPFGVKTVEAMAFWNCWTLETLRIPATVQSIGQIDMLGGCCEKLSAIVVDAANPVYASLDGALCSKDGTVLYYLPENIGTYTVPDSVTRIANGAIQFTTSRQEGLNLTLPESLSMIEDGNFSFIHGVFTFLNPNLKIGSDWFMDCNAEKVVIRGYAGSTAQALAEEKNFAFEDLTISAQFQYTVDDTGTTITGYTGQGGAVEIPSVLGGKPVVAIGNNAFQMPNLEIRTDITAVILPEGLQSIGRAAFWGCAGITSIEIPDSVTEIGWAAFETCENLTSVTLPKNLTQISDSLFHNCPLTEIDLPQGITRIGDYAFRDTGLTAIVIPEGTLSIGKCAFEGCSELSAVTIPASVTEVGECAFANCPKLAPLDEILPEKLTKVIDGVVYNADGTQIIGILPTLSGEVRIADGITVIPQQLFADNTSITSVILPNSIKTIEWRAFSGCTSLAQIEFPEGLLTIGDYAFSSTGLTTVVLPSTLTTFGEGVFDGCTKLANIEDKSGKFLKVVDGIVYNVDGTQIISVLESCTGEVRIAEGVTEIPDFLFSQNERITGVVIPEGVTRIGRQAFEFCTQLQSVVLPESLMEIEEYAFLQCENLTQIRLPESLRTIGTKAFIMSGLTSVVLPEGLTQLGDEVFSVCEDLTSVTLPSTLTSMGECVFSGCNQLIQIEDESGKTVKTMDGIVYRADGTQIVAVLVSAPEELHIADGVTEISFGPFYNNSRITDIVVPESVAAIGEYAFRECENLNSILLPSSLNSIGKEAFPPAAVIRSEPDAYARTWAQENGYVWQCAQHGEAVIAEPAVPATRKRTGMTAKLQCSVCGAVLAEPEVIPVFDGKVMKLPAALKSVQRETFLNLPAECFVLPDGCLVIGEKAFADCKMLKLVEIPASVVAIADDAFEGCENVLIVTPEGSAAERYAQRHGILVTSDDP